MLESKSAYILNKMIIYRKLQEYIYLKNEDKEIGKLAATSHLSAAVSFATHGSLQFAPAIKMLEVASWLEVAVAEQMAQVTSFALPLLTLSLQVTA